MAGFEWDDEGRPVNTYGVKTKKGAENRNPVPAESAEKPKSSIQKLKESGPSPEVKDMPRPLAYEIDGENRIVVEPEEIGSVESIKAQLAALRKTSPKSKKEMIRRHDEFRELAENLRAAKEMEEEDRPPPRVEKPAPRESSALKEMRLRHFPTKK